MALAGSLRISTDEIIFGRKPSEANTELPIQNVLLLDRFRELKNLPREDQDIVVQLVDAVIAKRQMEEVLERKRKSA